MIQPQKEAIIIAGANGVGKTTFAHEFLRENPDYKFLNADEIAGEISPGRPEDSPLTAGKVLFERLTAAVNEDRPFILETTLSGRYLVRYIEVLHDRGYMVTLIFVFSDSAEILIERIRNRVAKGGHFVPDGDVRRRFKRGTANFRDIYKDLVDSWALIYNFEGRFYDVALGSGTKLDVFDDNLYTKFMSL